MDPLLQRCRESLKSMTFTPPLSSWDDGPEDEAGDRLFHEWTRIEGSPLRDALVIAMDVGDYARTYDVLLGPGSGSVCASYVAFLAAITSINPIEHDLLFERFALQAQTDKVSVRLEVEEDALDDLCAYLTSTYGDTWGPLVQVLPSVPLSRAAAVIRELHPGVSPTFIHPGLPVDDPAALRYLAEGGLKDVHPVAWDGAESILDRGFKLTSFEDLVFLLACTCYAEPATDLADLWRTRQHTNARSQPGVNSGSVSDIVGATHGLVVYQEQALRLFRELGGVPYDEGMGALHALRKNDSVAIETFRKRVLKRGSFLGSSTLSQLWHDLRTWRARPQHAHFVGLATTVAREAYLLTNNR
jgi:DNA polymerase III alpha subunit